MLSTGGSLVAELGKQRFAFTNHATSLSSCSDQTNISQFFDFFSTFTAPRYSEPPTLAAP
jgi:hypothetical protein